MESKGTLGYWNIRGRGQPVRFILEYLGVDYNERRYKMIKVGDDVNGEDWTNEKNNLGLDFPNIPYWIDKSKGIYLTETSAIVKYIVRTYGPKLLGTTPKEQSDAEMLESVAVEYWIKLVETCYRGDDNFTKVFRSEQPGRIEKLSKFLGNKKWFTGDNLTYVDFWMYEFLYTHNLFDKSFVEAFPNLKNFVKNFENLPSIKAYINSDKYIKGPAFGLRARQNLGL